LLLLNHQISKQLLGAADLGISMHTSTSGLDLPMKVVDMFGAGLPVCAVEFACIDELVKDGVNGRTFKNASSLAVMLNVMLAGFPGNPEQLIKLRDGISSSFQNWETNWQENAKPLFATMVAKKNPPHNRFRLILAAILLLTFVLVHVWLLVTIMSYVSSTITSVVIH
jgi:amino acid permease